MSGAKVMSVSDRGAIEEGARIVREGGVVAFPTETVYGLGADATNPLAVAKIFEIKHRPSFDPLIVHVAGAESAAAYGTIPDKTAGKLIRRFWPGPLTLVVAKSIRVPDIVTAGLETVALRMPSHSAARALIRAAGRPIAAPSANLFGRVSPTEARHVVEQLGGSVDLILDGGPCEVGIESTILSLAGDRPCVLRAGGVPIEEIEKLLGPVRRFSGSSDRPDSPGQMTRHYATRTPLRIMAEETVPSVPGARIGLLTLAAARRPELFTAVEVLSKSGDLREAAAALFAALHRLDGLGLEQIVAVPVPEVDLGIAIMDRLRRCAAGNES